VESVPDARSLGRQSLNSAIDRILGVSVVVEEGLHSLRRTRHFVIERAVAKRFRVGPKKV
jgi:hypothetical protein